MTTDDDDEEADYVGTLAEGENPNTNGPPSASASISPANNQDVEKDKKAESKIDKQAKKSQAEPESSVVPPSGKQEL